MNKIKKFIKKYQKMCDKFGLELVPYVECHNKLLRWIIKLFGRKSGLIADLRVKEKYVE